VVCLLFGERESEQARESARERERGGVPPLERERARTARARAREREVVCLIFREGERERASSLERERARARARKRCGSSLYSITQFELVHQSSCTYIFKLRCFVGALKCVGLSA
jgi:hypothetical protein